VGGRHWYSHPAQNSATGSEMSAKINTLKVKKIDFLHSTNFKL
jgi:hypothetical protein